ncbi:hypothetical protein KSP40_PGU006955 [Platanthera guangdongensis]|uniref:Tr-type G domain-containing protein n=1 Tax=Platanthera guangdongensis TaxID=2320717 RepID=A0ABR2LM00_9ASPA
MARSSATRILSSLRRAVNRGSQATSPSIALFFFDEAAFGGRRALSTASLARAKEDKEALWKETLDKVRNIGISAHIDSGKTTLTERILFYTGRIHEIHEVRGRDGVGAKMDSMDLEREKGITIQSAATYCTWKDYQVNIIDTPGHVDFTIEVERALRVLDGAILVLCSVGGVQSQSITVDRQMRRYGVPRVAFINKLDRMGADPWKVLNQARSKLRHHSAAVQVPIGLEEEFEGLVDLVELKACYFHGSNGENIVKSEVPSNVERLVTEKRRELIEVVSEVDDELADSFLNDEPVSSDDLKMAIRRATISQKFVPVYMGSAFKNKGVQPLLDGVLNFLPCPIEVENYALDQNKSEEKVLLSGNPSGPLVALAFKLEEGRFGQLTYLRIYEGIIKKGDFIININTGKKIKGLLKTAKVGVDGGLGGALCYDLVVLKVLESDLWFKVANDGREFLVGDKEELAIRVPRLVRMHANEMEDIQDAHAGQIVAVFGVDCASGDTFTDGSVRYTMTSMNVPEPVMSLALSPISKDSGAQASHSSDDLAFFVHLQCIVVHILLFPIRCIGAGRHHRSLYIEDLRGLFKVDAQTGRPRVNFRETITQRADFDYLHKKQTGGQGQYGRVCGTEKIRVSGGLTPKDQGRMLECIQKNVDIFSWNAAEMPGVDADVTCHRLNLDPGTRPVQQKKRSTADKLAEPIREEVAKLLKVGFVSEIQYVEPLPADVATKFEFENMIIGQVIPSGFIPAIEKGFKEACNSGSLIGHPIENIRIVLTDGASHNVDSSELAFKLASIYALRQCYTAARPVILEPIMKVELKFPTEFQGTVTGDVNKRKGIIVGNDQEGDDTVIIAHCGKPEISTHLVIETNINGCVKICKIIFEVATTPFLVVNQKRDAKALICIQQGVRRSILPLIIDAKTSKEAWEILEIEYWGSEHVISIRLALLWRDFDNLNMNEVPQSRNVNYGSLTVGASTICDMSNNKGSFVQQSEDDIFEVIIGDGHAKSIEGKGIVAVKLKNDLMEDATGSLIDDTPTQWPNPQILKDTPSEPSKIVLTKPGRDFSEMLTLVAWMETIRTLLAFATQQNLQIHQLDVKSAFLNDDLSEDVFVQHPEGYMVQGEEEKLKKALYGLR